MLNGRRVPIGFVYSSDNNTEWMSVDSLRVWIEANRGNFTKS